MLNYIFQILPIILAAIAAVSCAKRFAIDRRRHDRIGMIFGTISAVILIIAQTSWWATYAINGSLQGTEFANFLWTVFNNTIMICLIFMAKPWRI